MPEVTLSRRELRLAAFSRVFAIVYALAAAAFAFFADPIFQLVAAPPSVFAGAFGAALCAAIATACGVAAARPRERRHALLGMVVANLTTSAIAAVELMKKSEDARRAAWVLLATDLPLFLAALIVYRGAAPGVHSAPAREGPQAEPEVEAKPVRLGVSKSS